AIAREPRAAGVARAGLHARGVSRQWALAGGGAGGAGLPGPVHRVPQHGPCAPGLSRPAAQGLVARAPRGQGATRGLPAGLHAEAGDEAHDADRGRGAGYRGSRRVPPLTHEGPAGFPPGLRSEDASQQPKMILSAITKIAVSTNPAQSVPLTVASTFLPALALSGVAGPTTALASTRARMIRNTIIIVIFEGRAPGVKRVWKWLAVPMKNSNGIDSIVLVREASPPQRLVPGGHAAAGPARCRFGDRLAAFLPSRGRRHHYLLSRPDDEPHVVPHETPDDAPDEDRPAVGPVEERLDAA